MSKLILLTRGLSAIVDDCDYDYLSQWKWHVNQCGGKFYAARSFCWHLNGDKRKRKVQMHRELVGVRGLEVDHINGDGLDNRRENLRIATTSQNQMNRRGECGVSKYKGVAWHNDHMSWQVRIKFGSKRVHLGYFKTEMEAAKAYDEKAIEIFGQFALTNKQMFPELFAYPLVAGAIERSKKV